METTLLNKIINLFFCFFSCLIQKNKMDSMRSYGERGMAFVKANPMLTLSLLLGFVMAVLAIVTIVNVRAVNSDSIADSKQKNKLNNAKRASLGMAVVAVIGAIVAYINQQRK